MPLEPAPAALDEAGFVARFGGIYEHSDWVARQAWRTGIPDDAVSALSVAPLLATQVDAADEAAQLALIRAHPDLAGRAAQAGELTEHSAREQAGAGLDRCTPAQFERLQQLNRAYTEKFGFPFVIAVTGLDVDGILAAMERRLDNDADQERRTAIAEIHKIARIRLEAMERPV